MSWIRMEGAVRSSQPDAPYLSYQRMSSEEFTQWKRAQRKHEL
jgi:hypothetical protein